MAAFATSTITLTEQEYLHAHFEGERTPEYVDGHLVERTMPNTFHGEVQIELGFRFRSIQEKFSVYARSELRLRVAPRRYRIADLAVFHPEKPREAVPEKIPFLIVEIVSPDDTWLDTMTRLNDYQNMGVEHIWLVDLEARQLFVFTGMSLVKVDAFDLPSFAFHATIDDLLPVT